MAAVVFGPDRTLDRSRPRIGLVLGAGGVLGAAWMTGALACLQDRLPCAAADVDLVVGAALVRPLDVPPWVGVSGWLPSGRGRHVALRSLVAALDRRCQSLVRSGPPSDWADGRIWIAAMDYDTGKQVLFGRAGAPRASLPDAVVASCSIPGWYEPTVIGGRRYVDGGVRSMTSLSALSQTDVQEVYVLAPMASTEPDHPLQPHLRIERRLRQFLTRALIRQARALGAQGKRVTVVTPGAEDLAVMGANLMDPRRREAVLGVSFRTSAGALARLDVARPRAA